MPIVRNKAIFENEERSADKTDADLDPVNLKTDKYIRTGTKENKKIPAVKIKESKDTEVFLKNIS